MLDEATSHLDTTREQKINAAIEALDTTRLVIAHRDETIAAAGASYLVEALLGSDRGSVISDG